MPHTILLVTTNERRCSLAEQVTTGLALDCLCFCITAFSGSST